MKMSEKRKTTSFPTKRPPENPNTLREWLWRVKRYENGIFVREQAKDGSRGNVALSSLPPDRWAFHVARWLSEGRDPVRVREDEEIAQDQAKKNPAPRPLPANPTKNSG